MKKFKNKLLQGPAIIRIDEEQMLFVVFTSDLHLCHKNILHFTKRMSFDGVHDIDSMADTFARNINIDITRRLEAMLKSGYSTGGVEDNLDKIIMFNCGDVVFASAGNSYDIMTAFRKKLYNVRCYNVVGNHEINNLLRGCEMSFEQPEFEYDGECRMRPWYWNSSYVVEVYRGAQCVMVFTVTHQPMRDFYGSINIHGHLHQTPSLDDYKASKDYDLAVELRENGRYQDVGMDRGEGHPIWLTDILQNQYDLDTKKIPQLAGMKWGWL